MFEMSCAKFRAQRDQVWYSRMDLAKTGRQPLKNMK